MFLRVGQTPFSAAHMHHHCNQQKAAPQTHTHIHKTHKHEHTHKPTRVNYSEEAWCAHITHKMHAVQSTQLPTAHLCSFSVVVEDLNTDPKVLMAYCKNTLLDCIEKVTY